MKSICKSRSTGCSGLTMTGCAAALLAFITARLEAEVNPTTNAAVGTLLGGNHSSGPFVVPFTPSFKQAVPLHVTGDYSRSSGATGDSLRFDISMATSSGGSQSEGSSAQQGSSSCDCECTACDMIPYVTPLIGGGDGNADGLSPDSLKLVNGSGNVIPGGLTDNMVSLGIRLGGSRDFETKNRAAVPMGNLFHLAGDVSSADFASPEHLCAQAGIGGKILRNTSPDYIRQWIGDRHLLDVSPVNEMDLDAGYRIKFYTYTEVPGMSGGFYVPDSGDKFMELMITSDGGLQVIQSTGSGGTLSNEIVWTISRSGTSPNFTYSAVLEKYTGGSNVNVRRHSCALYSVSPPKYYRTVDEWDGSAWVAVFKMKEEWVDFTEVSPLRRRIVLQERYANSAATLIAERREWTYYDDDETDWARYGRAESRRDYGYDSGGTPRLVHWEDYDYTTTESYDVILIDRSLHGSAEGNHSLGERIYLQFPVLVLENEYTLEDYPERPLLAYIQQAGKMARRLVRTVDITSSRVLVTDEMAIGPSTDQITTREYYGSASEEQEKFRPKRFAFPDGTVQSWTYDFVDDEEGPVLAIESHGYDAGMEDVINRQIHRTWNRQGFLIEEEVYGVTPEEALLLFTTWAVPSPLGDIDVHGRPEEIKYNGNEDDIETFTWGCCGLEQHRKRDGSITTYLIDKLKRVTSTTEAHGTSAALQHSASYAPRSNGGLIVERATGGLLDSRTHYDASGHIIQVDKLDADGTGEVSTWAAHYATSTGLRRTIIVHPDIHESTEYRNYYGDGSPESVTGTAVPDVKWEYSRTVDPAPGNSSWLITTSVKTIRLTTGGGTDEFSIEYRDLLGRVTKTEKAIPGGVGTTSYGYDNVTGQLTSVIDPDGVQTLYAYDEYGERFRTALDLNGNDAIDLDEPTPDDTDRVTEHTSDIEDASGVDAGLGVALVERSYVYLPGEDEPALVSARYTAGSGLKTRTESYPTTAGTAQITTWLKEITGSGINLDTGDWKETTTRPDSTQTVITYDLWRNATEQEKDSGGSLISTTTRAWQTSGRKLLASVTDARTGEKTFAYTNSGHLITETLTGPSPDHVTTYVHDSMGRVVHTELPDYSDSYKEYTPAGQVWKEWGSQSYSVRYSYDEQGRMKTLETFRGNTTNAEPPDTGGSPDVTTWNYEASSGRLAEKVYSDSSEVNYTYKNSGRLLMRTWARTPGSVALETEYAYTSGGDLLSVDYSDSTHDVLYSYYRTGQLYQVKDGTLSSADTLSNTRYTHTYTWNGLQAGTETIEGVHHQTKVLMRKYQDSTNVGSKTVINRYAGFEIGVSANPDQDYTLTYAHDTGGRILSVADPNDTFTYSYTTNAPHLIDTMTGPHHTAARTYETHRDVLATLTNTETVGTPSTISKFTYTVNNIGQRTHIAREGSAFGVGTSPMNTHFDEIGYNPTGEVTSTDRKAGTPGSPGSTISGFDYDWTFDGIGNRKKYSVSSTKTGYVATQLNQYSKTFNDTDGDGEQDGGESDLSNPTHDADGNMEQDANYDYTYDAENRLIQRTPRNPTGNKMRLKFAYDYRGRRVEIISDYHTGSAWAVFYEETILYDGWNPVMHYSYNDLYHGQTWVNRAYTWGLDLSGSLQGAGGVGGLLSVTGWLVRGSTSNASLRYYYAFDGNGNVSEVINYNYLSAYSMCAHHEYDAFGNLTRIDSGNGGWSIAATNPFRFSTKWHDLTNSQEEWGTLPLVHSLAPSKLYYYGYRFYAPEHGRWINRDPLGETGGIGLYSILKNDALDDIDNLGLTPLHNWMAAVLNSCFKTALEAHTACSLRAKAQARKEVTDVEDAYKAEVERRRASGNKMVPNMPNTKREREWGGRVCKSSQCADCFYCARMVPGGEASIYPNSTPPCDEGDSYEGFYHSHPRSTGLSAADARSARAGVLPPPNKRRGDMRSLIEPTKNKPVSCAYDDKQGNRHVDIWQPSLPADDPSGLRDPHLPNNRGPNATPTDN
jgi:RHS repeat-associated protein